MSEGTLTFDTSPGVLGFGIIALLATVVLAAIAWQRSGFAKSTGALEALRILIVSMVAISLLKPEWRELFQPEHKPTLAVLWDQSGSMATEDVVDPDAPAQAPKSRELAMSPFLNPDAWAEVGEGMDVVFEPFSSDLEPATSASDLNSALAGLLEDQPNLRGVVFLSDGDWNVGDPPARAAALLGIRGVPVFVVPVGSETRLPDVELVSLDAPTFGVVGKPLRVPFVIDSALSEELITTVELTTSTGDKMSREVVIPPMGRLESTLTWHPANTGEQTLTLTLPMAEGEFNEKNNALEAPVDIREEQLKVLVVESFARWEYRYLRNALERDPGVDVSCLLFHPDLGELGGGRGYLKKFPGEEGLAEYDVIVLGDVGIGDGEKNGLTEEQCQLIRRSVQSQAAGLVFLPGFRGGHMSLLDTELGELYPVLLDTAQPRGWGSPVPGQFQLTEAGASSLLTRLEENENANHRVWEGLPGFQWFAAALRPKAGSEVLATHSAESSRFGRVPLIVTRTFGTGKILFMGTDGAWRWRKGVEDKYHYRFWGQVARWMAYQRSMSEGEQLRLFYSPDRPKAGGVVTLNANATSLSGEPLQQATVIARVEAPSGKTESVRLASAGGEAWGLFSGSFTPLEGGEYLVTLSCSETGATLDTEISVQGTSREKLGRPIRREVLEEIARLSGGQLMPKPEVAIVAAAVAELPEPEPRERRLPIWSHPLWAGLVLLLMGVFWVGRKMAGVI